MNLRYKIGTVLWQHTQRKLFRMEAEEAHIAALGKLQTLDFLLMHKLLSFLYRSSSWHIPTKVAGMEWLNPVGLAAGFSKNGEALPSLAALGFGCIEIGTITPRPQIGNPKPRVFRYPTQQSVINRYGFNSDGSKFVAERIRGIHRRYSIPTPLIFSIGANKTTLDAYAESQDLNLVVADYVAAFEDLLPVIRFNKDGLQINISSPNTPGLRDLFDRLSEFLGLFVEQAKTIAVNAGRYILPPLILKVAPDGFTPADYQKIVLIAAEHGFAGIEATNTTIDEAIKKSCGLSEGGGVSGEPLRGLATGCLAHMRKLAQEKGIDLIGTGGILNGRHAAEKWEAGAKAIQLYTGLIFRGPELIGECIERYLVMRKLK